MDEFLRMLLAQNMSPDDDGGAAADKKAEEDKKVEDLKLKNPADPTNPKEKELAEMKAKLAEYERLEKERKEAAEKARKEKEEEELKKKGEYEELKKRKEEEFQKKVKELEANHNRVLLSAELEAEGIINVEYAARFIEGFDFESVKKDGNLNRAALKEAVAKYKAENSALFKRSTDSLPDPQGTKEKGKQFDDAKAWSKFGDKLTGW